MIEIKYILFGWLLGLLSPTIIDAIKSNYRKKEFFNALCEELHDLQFRIAISSFVLAKHNGKVDKDYLAWLKPIVKNYRGNEPKDAAVGLIDKLIEADDTELKASVEAMRAKKGVGLGLKIFSASFLDSNYGELSRLPVSLQLKIHVFRNQFSNLNQEIIKANERLKMTFDSSISDENHKRLNDDLSCKYVDIQDMCKWTADKLTAVLSEKIESLTILLKWLSRKGKK